MFAAALATIGGTIMSGIAQNQQAKQEAKWMKYNAAVAESKAKAEERSALYAAGAKREEGRTLRARQLALYAKAGVSPQTGSPLLTMQNTAAEVERDARLVELGGRERAGYLMAEAGMNRAIAGQTKKAGLWSMGTTLLTGIGRTAMDYSTYKSLKLAPAGGYTKAGLATISRY